TNQIALFGEVVRKRFNKEFTTMKRTSLNEALCFCRGILHEFLVAINPENPYGLLANLSIEAFLKDDRYNEFVPPAQSLFATPIHPEKKMKETRDKVSTVAMSISKSY
ncbi:hypothetical protein HDU77_011824, partial [Chytriomyces hyalinus]